MIEARGSLAAWSSSSSRSMPMAAGSEWATANGRRAAAPRQSASGSGSWTLTEIA